MRNYVLGQMGKGGNCRDRLNGLLEAIAKSETDAAKTG
jgi:hypothetical protein